MKRRHGRGAPADPRRVLAVTYHRNGISGVPFYGVTFTDPDSAREVGLESGAVFLAVVPADADDVAGTLAAAACPACYVVALDAPEERWRGDHYHEFIAAAIREHNAAEDRRLLAARSALDLALGREPWAPECWPEPTYPEAPPSTAERVLEHYARTVAELECYAPGKCGETAETCAACLAVNRHGELLAEIERQKGGES